MIRENKIKIAHDKLKTAWGIGDKIASFYLRDIFWLGSNLKPDPSSWSKGNLHLLQPIDIWVDRAAKALGHKNDSTQSTARFICSFEKENNLLPGQANISFWMLGSNYLESENDFKDVIKAISSKSPRACERTLRIAEIIEYQGRLGTILKKII